MARSITFERAVAKAIESFYAGSNFDSYEKVSKQPLKYNLDMFDEIQTSYKRRNKRNKKKNEESSVGMDDIMEDFDAE